MTFTDTRPFPGDSEWTLLAKLVQSAGGEATTTDNRTTLLSKLLADGGTGAAATPTFRALVAADVPAVREYVTASRTYYVATTGSDAASGLAADVPFLTLAKALAVATSKDVAPGYSITIQLADGTYSQSATLELPPTGFSGPITIQGNVGIPGNVIVNSSGAVGSLIRASLVSCDYILQSFEVASAHSANLVVARYGAKITVRALQFGTTAGTHMGTNFGGRISITSNYTITGGAFVHLAADICSFLEFGSITVTASNSPAFTIFIYVSNTSIAYTGSVAYSGTITGKRYQAEVAGVLNTNGGGANYFPGNSAGSVASGAQYL